MIVTLGILAIAALAVWRAPARYRLAIWVVTVMAVVVPWRSFQPQVHWDRIQWIPFVSPPVRVRDVIGNLALYLPLGVFYGFRRPQRPLEGIFWALVLSVATEASQLYGPRRYPSAQDVLMNVCGAALGIVATRQRVHVPRPAGRKFSRLHGK